MALTPEDVVNKRFQPTKFREGYDQDEVDDFLDEVVVELRRHIQENDELRQRLIASDSRINELQRSGGQAPQYGGYQPPQVAAAPIVEEAAPVAEPAPLPAPVSAGTGVDSYDANGTNNLLQLARRLHEEHVRDGIEKRDALIAEGHATAARLVGEAEVTQREQIGALEEEKTSLERRIDELRTFEREYRQKLKGHIEGLLRDLESSSSTTTVAASSLGATPAPTPASYQDFGGN